MTCEFPLCKNHPQANGYCIFHAQYSNVPDPEKEKKPLPKRSEKMKDQMMEYKKIVSEYLGREENKACVIKSPVCTGKATCVHHKKRRGKNLINVKYWAASCENCNGYVESHPKEAYEAGHLISVHKIEPVIVTGEEINGKAVLIADNG